MKIVHNYREIEESATAVALGTFDGVHVGHAMLIQSLKNRPSGLPVVVYTFNNIPASYFGADVKKLSTFEEKMERLEKLGVDYVYTVDFNNAVANESQSYFCDFLRDCVHAKMIAAGFNHSFGKGAAGNGSYLEQYGRENGIDVVIVDPVLYDGEPVSSTRIRRELLEGRPEAAKAMLGRPYELSGTVTQGKRLGRKLGFPTVNFYIEEGKLCPKKGVYGTIATLFGKEYYAVTNVGTRPTVDDGNRVNVETNVIGFTKDAYGERVKLKIELWQRPERRFGSVEELRRQLAQYKSELLAKLQEHAPIL